MKSFTLSKRDASQIFDTIQRVWPGNDDFKAKTIRITKIDDKHALLIGEKFMAVKTDDEIVPSLKMEKYLETIGTITVDVGAVRYVCNGANVMRPGVVQWSEEFKAGEIIAIKEAGHNKTIAVGEALVNSSELKVMSKGVTVKNLHYVGDLFWKALKTISL
jgi:PUA domain protein